MKGVWTALVTPFSSGNRLDLEAFKKILKDQADSGIDGVIPCGTTGEAPTLSEDEKKTLIQTAVNELKGSGVKVFATGGVGGVHRGAEGSFDISADLMALARYPVITVCAGAKAILDLPKTFEVLETLGVPVIGYQTDELPAFYSRSSGLKLVISVWAHAPSARSTSRQSVA